MRFSLQCGRLPPNGPTLPAVVSPRETLNYSALELQAAAVAARLAGVTAKTPRSIAVVERLPRGLSGKVDKKMLLDQAARAEVESK